MIISKGACFKGQLGNIVFIGKILDVFEKSFVNLDLLQIEPSKVTYNSVVWPYQAASSMQHTQTITEEQYTCMRSVIS